MRLFVNSSYKQRQYQLPSSPPFTPDADDSLPLQQPSQYNSTSHESFASFISIHGPCILSHLHPSHLPISQVTPQLFDFLIGRSTGSMSNRLNAIILSPYAGLSSTETCAVLGRNRRLPSFVMSLLTASRAMTGTVQGTSNHTGVASTPVIQPSLPHLDSDST